MATNTPTSLVARPSKIYPNWDFLFVNIPSGNPVVAASNFFPEMEHSKTRFIVGNLGVTSFFELSEIAVVAWHNGHRVRLQNR
jgi:hypothetical protein